MRLPEKFILPMNPDEFSELMKFDLFRKFKKSSREIIEISPFYKEGMRVLYYFNTNSMKFVIRIMVSGMMDPNEWKVLDYKETIRELKLENLLGED